MFEPKDKSFDKDSLQTPRFIYDWLHAKYNFNVDLCASDDHHYCDKYYTKENSCLINIWDAGANVGFCNPPYSNIDPFIHCAIAYARYGFTTVMLIPDFNGEERFDRISKCATVIIHLIGRVSFIRPDTGKSYNGNSRGSCVVEFSKKYWDLAPQHHYVKTKSLIDNSVIND